MCILDLFWARKKKKEEAYVQMFEESLNGVCQSKQIMESGQTRG